MHGTEEHGVGLQVIAQDCLGRWAAIEPIQHLFADGVVAGVGGLLARHFYGIEGGAVAAALDADNIIAVEHGHTAFAFHTVILAVPTVGLAGFEVVALISRQRTAIHLQDIEPARLALKRFAARETAGVAGVPLAPADELTGAIGEITQLVEVVH